jgi:DNA-3-methyladenine glycosylase II
VQAIKAFTDKNFISICNTLAIKDPDLQSIISQYGYPPLWKRAASFETLIHIILEQQVSLASALATFNKLKERIVEITPQNLLLLSDEEMKLCYFSRQKIIYSRLLARELISSRLKLDKVSAMDNDAIRAALVRIKGIGNWSVDIYLMMVLQRCNVFPLGDIALITSVKETKGLPKETTKEAMALIAEKWKPYQTVAAFILWHAYISKRRR